MLCAGAFFSAPVTVAQEAERPRAEVLVIDSDQLFSQSMFGRRVAQDLAAEEAVLLAENRRIQAELTAEEKALTEQRSEMDPVAFRAVAEAFDTRVVQIRKEQDQKSANLELQRQREQEIFIRAASPILTQIMQEAGASVVLERRVALLVAPGADVTNMAIKRLDLTLGDGQAASDAAREDE